MDEVRAVERLVASVAGDAAAAPRGGDCPDDESLASYAEGVEVAEEDAAPDAAREGVERHLSSCGACRSVVAALVPREAGEEAPGRLSEGPREFPARFGKYTVLRELGRGGMGIVYEAIHDARQRPEALKVLVGGLQARPELLERFRREVVGMANVQHPHVVPLFDSGELDGDLYFTMPLLGGDSLAIVASRVKLTGEYPPAEKACAVLDGYRFPPAPRPGMRPAEAYAARVAAALAGVADALATLHGKGILHRDVKPGNILLDGRGNLLLADFGLVRWGDQRITRAGQMLGTPAFMPPEQFRSDGKEPDERADVYALGATLYEMLTLKRPLEGDSVPETLRAKLSTDAPAVRTLNPAIPVDLEVLVARCLERRREDRLATAGALRDDLGRFARGERLLTRPVPPVVRLLDAVRRHRRPAAVAAAALVAAAGWHFSRPALLSVASLPAARVWIDGQEVASTPIESLRVAPGEHEVRLERERFIPFVRRAKFARGGTLELDRTLLPADPADPEALKELAAAVGIQVAAVKVEATRASSVQPVFRLLFPRGATRTAPRELRLWAGDAAEGWKAVLETADGSAPLATFALEPSAGGRVGLPLDDAPRARLDAGGSFRVRLLRPDGAEAERAEFSVLDAAARGRVAREWAAVRARFPEGGAALPLLEVEWLLGKGLHEEAYDRAVGLGEDGALAGRRETARAALAALDRAGLRGTAWWEAWVGLHGEAAK